jgi:hypothetical protein
LADRLPYEVEVFTLRADEEDAERSGRIAWHVNGALGLLREVVAQPFPGLGM